MTTESWKRFCRHFYGKLLKDIETKDKDNSTFFSQVIKIKRYNCQGVHRGLLSTTKDKDKDNSQVIKI